ncbi:MAG TPA: DUF3455 domain-containing protein [Chitinophagaceae bacterium]
MKKLLSKTIRGSIFVATMSLIISSCRKDERANSATPNAMLDETTYASTVPVYATCGTIPGDLKVPEGNKLVMQTYASGVQIYQVRRSAADPNVFVWVNTAPSAMVYAKPDFTNPVAVHYGGPTWEFTKGLFKDEKVVGTKLKGIPVDPTAVQWLLLKAVDSLSSPRNKITYIQRICTTGGLPPSTVPVESNLGTLDSIPYTANYLFYIKN